jgi:hypothetical protein
MCYDAAIASTGGDEATLAKSLIISLEDASTLGSSSKKSSCLISRDSKQSSIRKKIFCPALKEK